MDLSENGREVKEQAPFLPGSDLVRFALQPELKLTAIWFDSTCESNQTGCLKHRRTVSDLTTKQLEYRLLFLEKCALG